MGPVLPVVATAVSAFGAYSSYKEGKEAKKDAKRESEENIRRANAEDKARLAETRARAAASGIRSSGSPSTHLSAMEEEQRKQTRWMKKSGDARASSLGRQGTADAVSSLSKIPGYWD